RGVAVPQVDPPSDAFGTEPSPPGAPGPATPAPTSPPPTTPPPPTSTTTSPPDPDLGPVVWFPDTGQLQITLTNTASASSDYLVLTVRLTGQASIDGPPSGCGLTVPLHRTLVCGVSPLAPGASTVVTLPVAVDAPGQKARVSLCAVGFFSLDCDSDILGDTTKDLTP
ncbi:MAG: hypothetical protein ACRDZN_13580, partial [Acidimicrobiales bacterium]